MSINNFTTPPQVRVRTPQGVGLLERIWRIGDLWLSTVDHTETLQVYPLSELGPVRTDAHLKCSHVVRRRRPAPSIARVVLAAIPLALVVAMVGLAWIAH